MSQKIRQGNDIRIRWSILDADEHPYILEGRNVAVELNVGTKRVRIRSLEIESNVLIFTYYGKDQKYTGSYILKFIENEGQVDMVTFDTKDAFTLVEHSWQAIDEGETPETVQLEFVTVTSELHSSVGPAGTSAGFGEVTASVDSGVGIPSVEVTTSGPDTAKNFAFAFHNLKGQDGSDAEVTAQNIQSALGYVPVAPADISQFITATTNNLVNYYLKSETYNRTEIQDLISAIQGMSFVPVQVLPTASAETMNKIYIVPANDPQEHNLMDEYYTKDNGAGAQTRYTWELFGSASINMDGYVTDAELQAAIAAKQDVISDLATIRSGAAAGATAYQKPVGGIPAADLASGVIPDVSGKYEKPSTGIPKTDLASGVQDSLDLADSALQYTPSGEIDPDITPANYATREELTQLREKMINLVGMGANASEAGATTGDYFFDTYYNNIKHITSGGTETIPLAEGSLYMLGGEFYSCIDGALAKLDDAFGDWQLVNFQIGTIQSADGKEVANDKRIRTGNIYGRRYFFLPSGYLCHSIMYYDIATGNFDSYIANMKQYAHVNKSGCYARLVISRTDYAVITDSDFSAIRVPTRIDDIVKTISANYSTITEDIAVRDEIISEGWSRNNPVVTNTSRIRSAETTAWGASSGFNITRVKIPEFTKNVRIILKNNTVAPTGGYLAFFFSANDTGNAAYLSGTGEQSVLVGEKANINDIIPIPATALYIFLCTDISASTGDTINNNNLRVYFEADAEESVAVERLIMPAISTGYLVNSDTGELVSASGYPYVDIDLAGKNYKTIRTYVTAFSSSRGYGFFFSDNSWVGVRPSASGDKTIEVPEGATKFRFCWNPALISANLQYFFAGVANTPDEAYKKAKKNDIFFQFLPDFNLSNVPAVTIPQITSDLSDIYGRYDSLLAAYPNYITKIDCSDADSILGLTRPEELSGMPIYIYKFSPVLSRIETFDVRPKAMIISGTHADEKLGIYTTWQMMKIICENWTTIHDAQILRTMADIYVMPLLNPWGFVNANNTVPGVPAPGRQNYNGVNLNRNFPTLNWTLTSVGTDYSGASAGSEYETKIAMYYIQQLKPDFFLDAHTGNMNIYGAMGAIEMPNVQNLRAVAYCSARTATTQLMIEDSSFGTNPDQSLFDVGGFSATGELAAWVFENICDLAFLSEQCMESRWQNGVLSDTIQSSYTDTIFRENLQATYNLLLRCLYAAAISK